MAVTEKIAKRDLMKWARQQDREVKAARKARINTLAKVMLSNTFNLPDHQVAQLEQIITAAYGRQKLGL